MPLFLHAAIYREVSVFRWTSQNAFSRETAVYKWYCVQCCYAALHTALLLSAAIAAGSSNGVTNTRCCRYSCLRSWWWVIVPPEKCTAVSRWNKLCNVASFWTYIRILLQCMDPRTLDSVIINTVFWDVKPCDLVASYLGFEENCYRRLQGNLNK